MSGVYPGNAGPSQYTVIKYICHQYYITPYCSSLGCIFILIKWHVMSLSYREGVYLAGWILFIRTPTHMHIIPSSSFFGSLVLRLCLTDSHRLINPPCSLIRSVDLWPSWGLEIHRKVSRNVLVILPCGIAPVLRILGMHFRRLWRKPRRWRKVVCASAITA